MSPREVAEYTGFSVHHVRTMIRRGWIKAKKKKLPHQDGHYYVISKKEADKLKSRPKDNRGTYERSKS